MSYFDELEIDRTIELPGAKGEGALRLLYALRYAISGKAMALCDKGEPRPKQWVAVSPEWINLLGWTMDDLNHQIENPFHPDDFDNLIVPHGQNNLAAPYDVRIRKKGETEYGLYLLEGLSVVFEGRILRAVIVERAND